MHVNGADAQHGGELRPGDSVRTQPGAEIVFVTQNDAFLVRAELRGLAGGERLADGDRRGAVGVRPGASRKKSAPRPRPIGIRGTAVYIEAEPGRTYACTCYGTAVLTPIAQPAAAETVTTRTTRRRATSWRAARRRC